MCSKSANLTLNGVSENDGDMKGGLAIIKAMQFDQTARAVLEFKHVKYFHSNAFTNRGKIRSTEKREGEDSLFEICGHNYDEIVVQGDARVNFLSRDFELSSTNHDGAKIFCTGTLFFISPNSYSFNNEGILGHKEFQTSIIFQLDCMRNSGNIVSNSLIKGIFYFQFSIIIFIFLYFL